MATGWLPIRMIIKNELLLYSSYSSELKWKKNNVVEEKTNKNKNNKGDNQKRKKSKKDEIDEINNNCLHLHQA